MPDARPGLNREIRRLEESLNCSPAGPFAMPEAATMLCGFCGFRKGQDA